MGVAVGPDVIVGPLSVTSFTASVTTCSLLLPASSVAITVNE